MSDSSGPSIREQLGGAWQTWLPALFDEPVPRERRATCESCAMCAPKQEADDAPQADPDRGWLNPDVKCCTYHPMLASFTVGALLSDTRPELAEGQRRVRARIGEQHGVTPRGVDGPPAYFQRYHAAHSAFGRARDLLCPYYSEGACTVWRYREAVCSTYYCKHDQGEDGRRFWMGLRDYLLELQQALASHAMLELGFAPEDVLAANAREITTEELDRQPLPAKVYRARWKHYAGREETYYREAHALIARLSRSEVDAIAGVRVRARLMQLTALYGAIREPLVPLRLKRNPRLYVERAKDGTFTVEAYSSMDPSRMPAKLYDTLDAFDGRPSSEVRAELKAEGRAYPSEALLRGLYQHRVLIDAGAPPDAAPERETSHT